MKVYSPWDEPKAFMHDNVEWTLAARDVTVLPDESGAHAVRKLGATGVVECDEAGEFVRAKADAVHLAYLRGTHARLSAPPVAQEPGAVSAPHPRVVDIAAAIKRHEDRNNEGPEAA